MAMCEAKPLLRLASLIFNYPCEILLAFEPSHQNVTMSQIMHFSVNLNRRNVFYLRGKSQLALIPPAYSEWVDRKALPRQRGDKIASNYWRVVFGLS